MLTFELLKATTLPLFSARQNVVYFAIFNDNTAGCKVGKVFWT
jgi:hypothetical protein